MSKFDKIDIVKKIFIFAPSIMLFISVLSELDPNYLNLKYFSFNFTHILIFYCSLRKKSSIGYGYIFIAGLINDVVIAIPLGLSSLMYLIICSFAAYLKNITLRPSLIKDWIYFLITVLVVNSFSFIMLTLIFSYKQSYMNILINSFYTFLFYIVFAYCFKNLETKIFGKSDV